MTDDLTKMPNFKKAFLAELSAYLNPMGYKYTKTWEVFTMTDEQYAYKFYVYPTKWSNSIDIQTNGFISLNELDNKFKNNSFKELDKGLCGGEAKDICEKYFHQKYWDEYYGIEFSFKVEKDVKKVVEQWKYNFENIYMPFFEQCKNPQKLNEIVNGNIETGSLCRTYYVKAMYGLDIAKRAGMNNIELLKLANRYEDYIKENFDEDILCKPFLENKRVFFENNME